jgi:predicted lipid carrier protein YhbT
MNRPSLFDVQLPGFVSRIGTRLAQRPHAIALCTALNGALAAGWLKREDLAAFDGRLFAVVVEDLGATALFRYGPDRFHSVPFRKGAADVTFRAALGTYLKLLSRQEDPDTLFFKRELAIEGDTELGLGVKNMLDAIEWPALPIPPFRHD